MKQRCDPHRIHTLVDGNFAHGPVLYWMNRDQRIDDNWALSYAQELALHYQRPLVIICPMASSFLGATIRQYGFMLRGLTQLARKARHLNIPVIITAGENPADLLLRWIHTHGAGALVTDMSPLRIIRQWKARLAESIRIPFYEVDAHNIVPCWHASDHREYGAYTIRPKLKKLLPEYISNIPSTVVRHPYDARAYDTQLNFSTLIHHLTINCSPGEVSWLISGEEAAWKTMKLFITHKLISYSTDRNNPAKDALSNLSPYLHFGQISAQRILIEVMKHAPETVSKDQFIEELVIRRELAENFCWYEPAYDTPASFPQWAQKTLAAHAHDPRTYTYTYATLEAADTHDPLWNAAQQEMVLRGKMHGYMRMYWAKKLLEWTHSIDEAMEYAITLNDTYELDGRDPNGYAGIAWSLGGVHDRAWPQRPIFGSIRYMNDKGCKRKGDSNRYISQYTPERT